MRIAKALLHDDNGFTFSELIMVMFMMVTITVIGVPIINTVSNQFGLVLAAQSIATQLQYARMRAISSNEPFTVNFTASSTSYQVETGLGGTIHTGPYQYPNGVSLNTAAVGGAVTFPGGIVSFLPTGNVPATGNGSAGRLSLVNQSGFMIDIVVSNGGIIRQTPTYKTPPPPF